MTDDQRELRVKLDALGVRVEKVERYIWVAVAVLAVFGISGAFGAKWLSSVSGRLETVDKGVDSIYEDAETRATSWLEDAKQSLDQKIEIQRAWIPLDANEPIGTLPLDSNRVSVVEFPSTVPNTAREVLLYITLFSGENGQSKSAQFQIYTQQGETKYEKRFYWYQYPQDAVGFNSENIWFPVTSERKIYVRLVGRPNDANAKGEIFVLGYRE